MKDYFQILGLPPTATEQEIKTAYRKLTKKFHPDLNAQDPYFEQLFREVHEAYTHLTDPLKRQQYLLQQQKALSQTTPTLYQQQYFHKLQELKQRERVLYYQQQQTLEMQTKLQKLQYLYHSIALVVVFVILISFVSFLALHYFRPAQFDENAERLTENLQVNAQSTPSTQFYTDPEPVGGIKGFYQYIQTEMIYPPEAIKEKIEGEVIIKLLVDSTGNLRNAVIVKGLGYGCDEEALRLVRNAPAWKPATQNGQNTAIEITFPIFFRLNQQD